MRTRTIAAGPLAVVVSAVIFGGVATRSLLGQGQAAAAGTPALSSSDEFQQYVMPVLAENCVG